MKLRSARLDELELELVEPFETSFGVEKRRRFLLVALESSDGLTGYGECVASTDPLYSEETLSACRSILSERLLPELLKARRVSADAFRASTARFRGNRMAKAAIETALIDLEAKRQGISVSDLLGGGRSRIEAGVSVGIQRRVPDLVRRVGRYLEDGYRRIKLKVRPGWDAVPVAAVRREYPDTELWVDANQAYSPRAVDRIRRWAEASGVTQVEQAFPERAIRAHAELARGSSFRVCLDESIVDPVSLEDALAAGAISSLNVKMGRVGGALVGRDLSLRARRAKVPSWVGGMLESGIGRAHNVHLASLPSFTLSNDLSASDRYYREDLVEPPFVLGPKSSIAVPRGPGLGIELREDRLRRARRDSRTFRP